jgi:hypothetical protein
MTTDIDLGYAAVDQWRCGFGAVIWDVAMTKVRE